MVLVLYTVMLWLVAAYLFTSIQEKEIIRSIIIYFVFTILTVSSFDIISLNQHLVDVSQDKAKFLSLLLSRNIIMPFLVLIFINFFYRSASYKKIIPAVLMVLLATLLEYANLKLQLYTYIRWNFAFAFLITVFIILIIFILSKCINVIQLRSEHK